jgi:hypothetical protein
MGRWLIILMSGCVAGAAPAPLPQSHLTHPQPHRSQFDLRRGLGQQQQLDQERLRAGHGWQLHPRPQAPWEERRREDELRKEFLAPR